MNIKQKEILEKFAETEQERFDRHKKMMEQELGETIITIFLKVSFVYGCCIYTAFKILEYILGE